MAADTTPTPLGAAHAGAAREPASTHPLTSYQRDVWAAAVLLPQDPQFTCVVHERLDGPVDRSLLTRCVERALADHDTFRLRFDEHQGTPCQWVSPEPPGVRQVDLSASADPAGAVREWLEHGLGRAIALYRSPMVEATIVVEGDSVTHLHLRAHHIVLDGWTANQLSARIFADYTRRLTGQGGPAPADQVSYLSLLAAESGYRSSSRYRADLEFHQQALAGVEPALFARRQPSGTRRTTRHTLRLDAALVDRIRAASYAPIAYIAAVVGGYLARVHRVDEVVIGVPQLNRRGWGDAPLGQLANTLPLPVRGLADRPLSDLVKDVSAGMQALRRHERVPLGDVLRGLANHGSRPRALFDVTLSYLRYARPAAIDGLVRQTSMKAAGHDQSALNIYVRDFTDVPGIEIDLVCATDVFDDDLPITSVAGHLRNLLLGGLAAPDRPLATVPLSDTTERAVLLARSRGPVVNHQLQRRTLHGLFQAQCARRGDRTAVTEALSGRSLTYSELDRRANRLARALRARGVGRQDRVAVLMRRGIDLVVALFAVLKAGAAYVPVDPGYPAERIRLMLADSGARVTLVDTDWPWLPGSGGDALAGVATLGCGFAELLASQHREDPLGPIAAADDLAYVIYTSGSTGRPKGVMVEHRSVVNRLAWMQRLYPVDSADVLLQKTPVSFDVSVWELFWWAARGASLVLLPPGGEKDPRQILRAVADHQVTVLHFVPSMLGPFLDLAEGDLGHHWLGDDVSRLREQTRSLRYVFSSGEALPASHVERFARVFGTGPARPTRLVNLYGPTEAAVDVSSHVCPTDPPRPVLRVPIGRPVDNTALYVLDPLGQPQPTGIPGELHIGGVQVARGYLDRPELTRTRFVPDPFSPQGRLYRTGDLARWLSDGTIEYLGRLDGQVKVRGNRVETGEVAAALSALPGVRDAIVVGRPATSGGTRLIGYYTADRDLPQDTTRAALGRLLPDFMVPALVCRVEHIPLTPSGKADLRALPDPRCPSDPAGQEPRTATEEALARIWAEVLKVPEVGIHDDFYALGGDSVVMLTIRARAEQHGLHFELTDLVRQPTIAELARTVTPAPRQNGAVAALEPFALISRVDRAALAGTQDAYPLTRLQLGLIYHSRRDPHSVMYKDVFRYSVEVRWDEAAFRASVGRLVARHPVLRSTFDLARHSEPLQVIHASTTGHLDVVDLRGRGDVDTEGAITAHVRRRRRHEYDFAGGPLHQLVVFVRPTTLELVLSFHHALLDGGSVANLLREVLQDYAHALGLGIEPVPDVAPPSAAHHVYQERRTLAEATSRGYWQRLLVGRDPSRVDGMRPHVAPGDARQLVRHVELPADVVARTRWFAHERSVPIKSVLFAAHCLSLRLFTGADEVITGLITHGRPEAAHGERTLGLFLNTVPVRVNTAQPRWAAVVQEVLRQEREGYPHRRYPLSAIQRDHGGPVVETAFNYVHFRQLTEVLTLPGVRLLDFHTWEETNFQLLVNAFVDPVEDRIRLRIDCAGEAFSPEQADLLASVWVAVLDRMTQRPDDRLDFGFLAPAKDRVAPTEGVRGTVIEGFLGQVKRTPDAVAVTLDEQRWTYRELGRAADAVAQRLVAAGAGPGSRVGVAMDRSPQTIAVVVGTLLAGAAVVPLDPGYPPARLATMLEQSRPLCVIAAARHRHLVAGRATLLPAETVLEPPAARRELTAPAADWAACVLFTSGSTGQPKGVTMPHRTLANLVAWQNRAPSGAVGAATLQFAPLSFDVCYQEVFSTLCGGGTLVLVHEEQRLDMPALLRLIDGQGVGRVIMPYVALQQLAETSHALGIVPSRLRVVVSSGEKCRVTEQIRRFLAALPDVVFENQYGPTESHVVTAFTMVGDPATFPALPPVGRAIDGTRVHVLDTRMRPVPPGVRGEVYIGGVCLALGYEGRADLTAERFVRHPFGAAGELLYRTGDVAMLLPDQNIVCVGRADSQVKVRGHRVEPAEVEAAVIGFAERHPGIDEVAVVARRRAGGDAALAAFLVGDPDRVAVPDLRRHLRSVLAPYLMPSHITWLPAIPRTPSGKRNDLALSRMPLAAETASVTGTGCRDSYETTLVDILADLLELGAGQIGVDDDLFTLGGTSLTVMRLVVIIEQRYGINVPLAEFIASPTVAGIAERLRAKNAAYRFDPLVPIRREGARRPIFMVHPMGGNVLCYVPLARQLPADQPLYALQAAGADPGSQPRRSVPEMAADYVAALRRVQPYGPYTIGGWSFGGLVAFEIARQLERAGERVAKLVLLDTTALNPGHRYRHDEDALLGWFFWELLWLKRGGQSPVEIIPPGLVGLDEKFAFIADFAVRNGVLPEGSSGAVVRRLFRVYAANWNAALEYRPREAHQDVILLRATEKLPGVLLAMHTAGGSQHEDPSNGWRQMTRGRVRIVQLPGDHLSIMEQPHLGNTAATLASLLDERPPLSLSRPSRLTETATW